MAQMGIQAVRPESHHTAAPVGPCPGPSLKSLHRRGPETCDVVLGHREGLGTAFFGKGVESCRHRPEPMLICDAPALLVMGGI